ncbi:MAG: glycosyltransferase family 2 protein [Cyclobacteriaceae bacterium]
MYHGSFQIENQLMTNTSPKISMLIWTYNRADQVEISIRSVLNQTFEDFELILVDNGSTDHTPAVLEKYCNHPKVRLFRLEENRRVTGGMNFALDQMHGEWFATLGDHDEIVPHAFETLLQVVEEVDPSIDAVTANAISSTTGEFCGLGLDKDQYLPLETIVSKVSGDFFGIAKTTLLGDKRLNEKLLGNENSFWYKIDSIANRYYIHQGLKIFNTEEGDSFTKELKSMDFSIKSGMYKELINEPFFWEVTNKYNRKRSVALGLRGYFFSKIHGYQKGLQFYKRMMRGGSAKYQILATILKLSPGVLLEWGYRLMASTWLGHKVSQLLVKPFGEIKQNRH